MVDPLGFVILARPVDPLAKPAYATAMAEPILRSLKSWVVDHVLWDRSGKSIQGLSGAFWALRKVLVALLVSAVMTWQEWVKHHPPEIAIIAVIHFAFVLVAVALLVYAGHYFPRGNGKSQGGL
jgi:hypothetical protein